MTEEPSSFIIHPSTFRCVVKSNETWVEGENLRKVSFHVECERCKERSPVREMFQHNAHGLTEWHETLLYQEFKKNHRCGEGYAA